MKKKRKLKTGAPAAPTPAAGPTLLEFWLALKSGASPEEAARVRTVPDTAGVPGGAGESAVSGENAPTAVPSGAGRQGTPSAPGGGFGSGLVSEGGSGSSSEGGSGGGGYGLRLILPDPLSQERIRRIMRELCAQDEKRGIAPGRK